MDAPSRRLVRHHGLPCPWCGATMNGLRPRRRHGASRDHLVPRARGGGPTAIVCRTCNADKSDARLTAWIARLEAAGDGRAPALRRWMDENTALLAAVEAREEAWPPRR